MQDAEKDEGWQLASGASRATGARQALLWAADYARTPRKTGGHPLFITSFSPLLAS